MRENVENDVYKEQVINKIGRNLNTYNEAQNLNPYEFVDRWGNLRARDRGNTKIGSLISRLPIHNFGSIADYEIDTVPISIIRAKGQEVTTLKTDNKEYRNKQVISRRFLCNILKYWCYILGIRYYHKKEENHMTGLKLWAIPVKIQDDIYEMITGDIGRKLLKDILYLTRNKNIDNIKEKVKEGYLSGHLLEVFDFKSKGKNAVSFKEQLNNIKDRLYYDFQIKEHAWSFPKYNVEYLIYTMNDLHSGNYITEMCLPVIQDMYKYPIYCKDTFIKPVSSDNHNKAKDDYDIGQYIWERD